MADEQKPEQKSTVDKIIFGAIIGTAIGSAVGLTMAPKKGKETREAAGRIAGQTASGFMRLGKAIFRRLFKGRAKPPTERAHRPMKALPDEMEIVVPPETKE